MWICSKLMGIQGLVLGGLIDFAQSIVDSKIVKQVGGGEHIKTNQVAKHKSLSIADFLHVNAILHARKSYLKLHYLLHGYE